MKCYYILKALRHCLDSDPPTVYNTPDKLYWQGCCRATVKDTKANGKYEANKADTVMGQYRKFREETALPFLTIGKNALPPYLQANAESTISIQFIWEGAFIQSILKNDDGIYSQYTKS